MPGRRGCEGLRRIVSAAHELPAEVDPPARVWASLRAKLEEEGILSWPAEKKLQEGARIPMLASARELQGEEQLCGEPLRLSKANLRAVVEAIASAIFISRGAQLHYVNHAAEALTGYTREELLTMTFCDLVHPDQRDPVPNLGLSGGEIAPGGEVKILTKNHEERWLAVSTSRIDFDGQLQMLISAFDLTERKQVEAQGQLLTITDALTGLGNYRRLRDTLHAEIERSERTRRPFSILLLDLDGLKKINDGHGHLVGSRALCRLGNLLRAFCCSIDTAARYGGDEFAVILPETGAATAALVASRIRERLATDSEQPTLSASIGVAVYPQDGETIEALLQAADRELYGMKSGRAEEGFLSVAG